MSHKNMKLFVFLQIPIWANLSETGPPGSELDLFRYPRFNENCGWLENAEMCEIHCQSLYLECLESCSEDDQEIG